MEITLVLLILAVLAIDLAVTLLLGFGLAWIGINLFSRLTKSHERRNK